MFLMLVVGYLSLINVFIKNTAGKSSMSIHLFTNKDLEKKYFKEKNCKLVKILIIKETKERTYVNT